MKKIIFLLLLALLPLAAHAEKKDPRRVVVIVIDQMRPDYVDRYHLPNLTALRSEALEMSNAHVGHYPTITLMSHEAIATGLFPKNFGWSGDLYRDDAGLFGEKSQWYDVGDFSHDQFQTILKQNLTKPRLLQQLKQNLHGKVIVVGQKKYAALTFGGLDADIIVTLNKQSSGALKGKCTPTGHNVPNYISSDSRFTLNCTEKYGSEKTLYPFDSRYVPGDDPGHQGGDIWTTDTALSLMHHEKNWRVMNITISGVDRIGHTFGEADNTHATQHIHSPYHLEKMVRLADAQVGRIVEELKKSGLWEDTAFVVTADHGGLSAKHYYGNPLVDSSYNNLFGKVGSEDFNKPQASFKPLVDAGLVEHASFDTSIRIWLTELALKNLSSSCARIAQLPGSVAVYHKTAQHYELCSPDRSRTLPSFLNPQQLLDTMLSDQAPDVVVLLGEDTGYSLLGDHGGLQEKSLRIPLYLHGPNIKPGKSSCPMRLVDILPSVFKSFNIPLRGTVDGNAACFEK